MIEISCGGCRERVRFLTEGDGEAWEVIADSWECPGCGHRLWLAVQYEVSRLRRRQRAAQGSTAGTPAR
jgi:hypothetical protein